MKQNVPYSLIVILLLLSLSSSSQKSSSVSSGRPKLPAGVSDDWYSEAIARIQQQADGFYPNTGSGGFRVANTYSRLGFSINHDAYSVHNIQYASGQAKDWEVTFRIKGVGRINNEWTTTNKFLINRKNLELNYEFEKMTIQYLNEKKGLRQNFLVHEKPLGDDPLKVFIGIEGNLEAKSLSSNKLAFHTPGNDTQIKLMYDDLKVWDAKGHRLNAYMALLNHGKSLELTVDDKNAIYPITIDPLNHSSEWSSSADGVVSGLLSQTQLEASLYGFTVVGIGDVNGDTYGDIAIGAPSMVDIFSGSGTLASVGAVFVFYGSTSGLSTIPAKTLQPNTCVAGALFGASIDAGDVTGDGINDLVIGAPVDRITVTIIVPVHGTVGKVYVYPGGALSNPNPSNFLTLNLTTSHINLLNISSNALFGFSVSVTEDMNDDGKKDILVGSPTYASALPVLLKTGAAFLFLSGPGNTFPVMQDLQVPTFSLLGISVPVINSINGLLYGYSVDGVGDYNNDGNADIVVGAPAGVDISSLTGIFSGQVLGGQAYVYYGTGTTGGVYPNIGAKLIAQPGGLLGNAANLFGFDLKGVRGIDGQRNGSIVIGAPVGGLIPNVLGLTIQTGGIHVFKKKNSSPAGDVISDQVLESPRSTSILQLLNTLDLNVMLGASLDNAYDLNCDGFPDLVAGEPLSSGTGLLQLQVNAVGGAAYVYYGDGSGGYVTTPGFDVSATYGGDFLSVNATALFGFSVSGVRGIKGVMSAPRILVGSPSGALDFDNSVLNLGSTLGLLFDFTVGNNGVGKAYTYKSALCNDGATLPVTLTSFEGQKQDESVLLKWASTEEANLSRYELQRSTDGTNYSDIAIVFAKNSFSKNEYQFIDLHPVKGTNYYRLKMNDVDGKYTYSNIVTVRFDKSATGDVAIAPNPVQTEFRVKFNGLGKGLYKMELYSTAGQLIRMKKVNITQPLQFESMSFGTKPAPGIYWLNISVDDNKVKTLRVFVE